MPSGMSLVGKKFGALSVVRETSTDIYVCKCKCGSKVELFRSQLTKSVIRHCGCQFCVSRRRTAVRWHLRTYIGRDGRRHQKSSGEYLSWCSMKQRCFTKTDMHYPDYGGRGITVCGRWVIKGGQGFKNFIDDMGPRPIGTSLDRINVQGHYEPSNCQWSTAAWQRYNQRCVLFPDGNEPPVADLPIDFEPEFACG